MASMGLKYMGWAEMAAETDSAVPTYETGLVLGKMVSVNLAVTNAEGELYADDILAEDISEFQSGELTAEVDNITLENQAKLYGATYASDEMKNAPSDSAPYGGTGGVQVLSVNNVRKFRAWFFPKVRASVPDWDANTRGDSISFGTQPIKMKIMPPLYGSWRYIKEFTTEAAAKAYIDTKLGIAVWHTIDVQVQGAGAGEGGSPSGITSVANAAAFALTISGTATKLYDNGVDVTASIAAGTYTLASVTAAHSIALIYS